MTNKQPIYRITPSGEPILVAYQCYERLPFHHADYEVQNCRMAEGHEGAHRCNVPGCARAWEQRIDREQFWEEVTP